MSTFKEEMLAEMEKYFEKVRLGIEEAAASSGTGTGGVSSDYAYLSGECRANGSVVINAPAILKFKPELFNIYSMGIECRMEDPTYIGAVRVIDAITTLSPTILTDGRIEVWNNYDQPINYHIRITIPVKK